MLIEVLRVFTLHILVDTRYWYYSMIGRAFLKPKRNSFNNIKTYLYRLTLHCHCPNPDEIIQIKPLLFPQRFKKKTQHSLGFSQPVAGEVWPLLLEKAQKRGIWGWFKVYHKGLSDHLKTSPNAIKVHGMTLPGGLQTNFLWLETLHFRSGQLC